MFKRTSFLYFILFLFLIQESNQAWSQPALDSIFVHWNKSTIKSLNRQMISVNDSMQIFRYKNKSLAIKKYWNIASTNDVNQKSIRYEFLKTVFANNFEWKKNFYVIEANESGSKILLRTFVLYLDSIDKAHVEFYDFFSGKWKKTGKFMMSDFHLQSKLMDYITHFGKGFNYDDIIITEFKNHQIKQSEYYLYSTLSKESKIENVLEGYQKKNFIHS